MLIMICDVQLYMKDIGKPYSYNKVVYSYFCRYSQFEIDYKLSFVETKIL